MKTTLIIIIACLSWPLVLADEKPAPEPLQDHQDRSVKLAEEQDELSADVQQLVIEQTIPQVIELLGQVEEIMDEATDRLAEAETGGETMAAQTEIIEKIHAAAKERQSQSGSGESGGAMMDMMERMMGKQPEGDAKQQGQGDQPGDQGGSGMTGESDTAGQGDGGASGGKLEQRRVPKAAGTAGRDVPQEFRSALDAYNRGMEQKIK